jgi:hypothetical protein
VRSTPFGFTYVVQWPGCLCKSDVRIVSVALFALGWQSVRSASDVATSAHTPLRQVRAQSDIEATSSMRGSLSRRSRIVPALTISYAL